MTARAPVAAAGAKAAHLVALAARWRRELGTLARRRRASRSGRGGPAMAEWQHRHAAIAGALGLVEDLARVAARDEGRVEHQVVALRAAGLTFTDAARALGIPVGIAKTYARRLRLQGGAA